MENEILDAIRKRRSIRSFKPDPIPQEVVGALLEAARWAPSAGNLQPWEFYVVTDPGVKSSLEMAALGQNYVGGAPVVIVVCAVPQVSARIYGTRGRELYCLQDTACATQNILLAAQALGLGSCWVGAFHEDEVIKALDLPRGRRPVALVPIGYPSENPPPPARRSLRDVVRAIGYEAAAHLGKVK